MKRVFPRAVRKRRILPVDDYPAQLYDMLRSLSPRREAQPEVVVLTPGIYNSAYFEHAYLAQQMGVRTRRRARPRRSHDDDCVYMRTIDGLRARRRDLSSHRR